jgi:exopolysaccharide biosynthesis polyprenyl glycosylphosphotransferase
MSSIVGYPKSDVDFTPESSSTLLRVAGPAARQDTAANFRRYFAIAEVTGDFVTIMLAVMLAYSVYYQLELGKHIIYPIKALLGVGFALAVLIILMLDRSGAYARGSSLLRVRETEQVVRVSTQAFLVAFAISFFASFLFSRWLLVITLILVLLFLFIQKNLMYLLVRKLHAKGYGIEKVLIYGSGQTARRVYSVLRRSPKLGLDPLAFVDDDPNKVGANVFEMGYERRHPAGVVQGPITRDLVVRYGAGLVIIAIPSITHRKFSETVREVLAANARVSFVPSHALPSDSGVGYEDIDGVLLASFTRNSKVVGYEFAKRVCDLALSSLLLLLFAPVFLLLAALIKLDSPGPVFFRQVRVGKHGRKFKMWKFRTMLSESPVYEHSPRDATDPRITRIGKFLRYSSLDELPQVFNVLEGSMSLVGPRPEMPFIVEQYKPEHKQRLRIKPGITGLWQLSADRAFLIHENIEYDLYYMQNRNFFMDVAILLHTLVFAMRGV